jgi:hypothetical protein
MGAASNPLSGGFWALAGLLRLPGTGGLSADDIVAALDATEPS